MAFPSHILEEIKNRIAVSSIVGRRVKLIRRGREYVGLSPFKAEKTPSFTVNDDKQFYHCFATGKHGSIFDFVMETEGLSFPEAVERLASDAGVTIPAPDRLEQASSQLRKSLSDVMSLAAQWFTLQLAARQGESARDYLQRRAVGEDLRSSFGVGYAPSGRSGLRAHLNALGISDAELIAAGLVIKPDDGRECYDRFRDRIMFPIHDARGRIIAFGGRALAADAPAKYLNSPETELFHKGANLYNFHRARQPAYDSKQVLVAEGYMDVIGLARVGFHAAVAPLGTAITEQQLNLLWRLAKEPVLCLDGDSAGLRAAYRAMDRALPLLKPGSSLRFALLPHGKDPDDLAREGGVAAVQQVIDRAVPLVDLLWDREKEQGPLVTPEQRAELRQRLRRAVAQIQDRDVRDLYGRDIKQRLDNLFVPQNTNRRGQGSKPQSAPRIQTRQSSVATSHGQVAARPALLVAAIIAHPELLIQHSETFERLEMPEGRLQRLHGAILDAFSSRETLDRSALIGHLKGLQLDDDMAQVEAVAKAHGLGLIHPEANFEEVEPAWLEVARIHYTLTTLEREKSEAEADFASDGLEESFERLKAIMREIATVEGRAS